MQVCTVSLQLSIVLSVNSIGGWVRRTFCLPPFHWQKSGMSNYYMTGMLRIDIVSCLSFCFTLVQLISADI